jgi:hypothetical protein
LGFKVALHTQPTIFFTTSLFPRTDCSGLLGLARAPSGGAGRRSAFTDKLGTMIQTIDLRGTEPTPAALLASVPRALTSVAVASDIAAELIADVRERGEAALLDQAERLDRVRPGQVRVPASHIADAVAGLDPAVRTAITETIRRVRLASAAQVPPHVTTTIEDGATVTQRWQPVNRVGLYVPGGKAVYPSSVVMNVVPAQVSVYTRPFLPSPGCSVSMKFTPWAAPARSALSPTASRTSALTRCRSSPAPATSMLPPPNASFAVRPASIPKLGRPTFS